MMFTFKRLSSVLRVPCSLLDVNRHLLTKKCALNKEWTARHSAFRELGIEGGYEWIAAVQKKFFNARLASAVDVDVAVCTAEELDQVDDVLKIVYKLRHTIMTGQMLPSTEYALIRLLLKHHNKEALRTVLADPINYGIFLNEHSACLVLDYFLEADEIANAAQVASYVMLQEMFQSVLLNLLCIYIALKWTELPAEQRVFEKICPMDFVSSTENESMNMQDDEDERTFKFPYLKNEYNDMHFDLTDPNQLVGKSLLWFSDHVPLSTDEVGSIRFVGSVFFGNYDLATQLLRTMNISSSAIVLCLSKLEQKATNCEQQKDQVFDDKIKNLKAALVETGIKKESVEGKLSEMVMKHLRALQDTEEKKVMEVQRSLFIDWNQNRADLIKAQVEQLDLTLRLKEINEERHKLHNRWEELNFFENRLKWEDLATVKEELLSAEQGKKKSKEDLEEEYVEQVFLKRNARQS